MSPRNDEAARSLPNLNLEEKRELLKKILEARSAKTNSAFPLSYGQRAIWFLQKLAPETFAYNLAFCPRFRPRLNEAALVQALGGLAERHASLRTIFLDGAGEPLQRVEPPAPVEFQSIGAPSDEAALAAAIIADYQRPFPLSKPLFRVTLFRESESDLLLLTFHHLVLDARSVLILCDDLRVLYEAQLSGAAASLRPVTAQYRDFVSWQNAMLRSAEGDDMWGYWREKLTGILPPLELPSARPRPAVFRLLGQSIGFTIDASGAAQLRSLAQRYNTTFYVVMLSALRVLLYQFTGQRDLVIGSPVSARTRPEWAGVVGYFVNMLPLRTLLRPAVSFATLLEASREDAIAALARQDFPFPVIVERMKLHRDPARTPIFQVMLNVPSSQRQSSQSRVYGATQPGQTFGGSAVEPYEIPQQEGQFELTIEIVESDSGLSGNLKFASDVLDRDMADRMLASLVAILKSAALRPEMPIEELLSLSGRDEIEI